MIVGTLFYLDKLRVYVSSASVIKCHFPHRILLGDWIHFERRLGNMRLLRMKEFVDTP